ncbi:MAG: FTR1 family protein [Bdellovibrionales bacterium]|nr:FTR1 family protein [Bdellovibrionales bacterium]
MTAVLGFQKFGAMTAAFLLGVLWSLGHAQGATKESARRAISLLDYIGRDYVNAVSDKGQIISDLEYQEMQDFSALIGGYLGQNEHAQKLQHAIQVRAVPAKIKTIVDVLRIEVMSQYNIVTYPEKIPDLVRGKRIYDQTCAQCHGQNGNADTPVAKSLTPPPSAFSSPELLDQLSPFQAFNTITYGVVDTAMPGFESFSEHDRWSVASYLFTLRKGLPKPEQQVKPLMQWKEALGKSDQDIISFLKNHPARVGLNSSLGVSRDVPGDVPEQLSLQLSAIRHMAGIQLGNTHDEMNAIGAIHRAQTNMTKSLEAFLSNEKKRSIDYAVSAYLDGFEPVEALLVAQNQQELVKEVEREFLRYRSMLSGQSSREVELSFNQTMISLQKAELFFSRSGELSAFSTWMGTAIVIFREGLEAILLISIILTCLNAIQAGHLRRWVHRSWIFAIALGVGVWFLADNIISGSHRENIEGFVSLLACTVLIYVSFWLLSKKDAKTWTDYLLSKLKKKKTASVVTIITVSFFAVFREVFETVLFIQTIKLNSQGLGLWIVVGLLTSLFVLLLIARAIFYLGAKLPLNIFFSTTGHFLFFLAIIFLGQGIHSLGEVGLVSLSHMNWLSIPSLGAFPYKQTVFPQVGLIIIYCISLIIFYRRSNLPQAPAKTEQVA